MPTLFKNSVRALLHRTVYAGYLARISKRIVETRVAGISLTITPTVMHPRLFKSGRYFAEYLLTQDFTGKHVLDMGTGSGILAIVAAAKGGTVTAVDKNSAAVQCARDNTLRNGLAGKISVIHGDFFSEIGHHNKFDTILFNPPFLYGIPTNDSELALYAGDGFSLLNPFARELKSYLKQNGYLLMVLSSDSDILLILNKLEQCGFFAAQVHSKRLLFETLYVFRIEQKKEKFP